MLSPIPGLPHLSRDDTESLARQILTLPQQEEFALTGDLDFAYSVAGQARFRVNALSQRGSPGLILRRIPVDVPDIDELGLPPVCKELALKSAGLVLITGPAGSGKSTTLAAMIDYRNRTATGHILTIEDPIEFVHRDRGCYVNQREVGSDTPSYLEGLRRSLRQDPDVIMIGALPDLETIAMVLAAAENGHLVLASLHTMGAHQTVNRIVDVFPPEQRHQVRVQLAGTFQGVVSQLLLQSTRGGRLPVFEVVTGSEQVRSCIREDNLDLLRNIVATGTSAGMVLFDTSLIELTRAGLILPEEAIARAMTPADVRKSLSI